MAATPLPTTTVQIPGTVNPVAHAAAWGSAKVHQIVQARHTAIQQKAKTPTKGPVKGPSSKSKSTTTKTHTTTTTTKPASKAAPTEKPWYEQNRAQLHHMIEKSVQGQAKEEEASPHQRLQELAEIKATGEKNLQANTASTAAGLQGLGTSQEASAKTAENEAADRAQQAIARVGAGNEGTTPGVQNAESQFLASVGASGVSAQQNRSAAESNYLASLGAAARVRGQEQLGSYAGKMAGAEGTENQKLAQIKANEHGQISSEELKLIPEQSKTALAAKELGVKQTESVNKNRETERKTTVTQNNDNTKNKLTAQSNATKEGELNRKERETRSEEEYRRGTTAEKAEANKIKNREAQARIKNYESKTKALEGNGTLNSTQGKAVSEMSRAAMLVKTWKEQGKTPAQMREFLYRGSTKVSNGVYAEAAIEVVEKGELSGKTKKALETAGELPSNFALSNYILGEGNR
jgi:hypothetical protein